MSDWPPEPDLSGWESCRSPFCWAYNALREADLTMTYRTWLHGDDTPPTA